MAFAGSFNLEQAIDRAIEKNSSIRELDSNISALDEQVRSAKSQVRKLDELYKSYRRYVAMYNDTDEPYEHIKNMSDRELIDFRNSLPKRIQALLMRGRFQRADDLTYELKFASYALIFGTDEPKLTKQQLYRQYVKMITMTGDMAQKERDKALNNREVIKSAVSVQMTKLYINVINLREIIDLNNDMIVLRKQIAHDLSALLEHGMVPKNFVWENEQNINILTNDIDIYKRQIDVLMYNINTMLAQDIQINNHLKPIITNPSDVLEHSIMEYVKTAQNNSPLLKGYELDLAYAKKDMELYLEYDGAKAGRYYEDLVFSVDSLERKVRETKSQIEIQVKKSYENIIIAMEQQKNAKLDLDAAKLQRDNAYRIHNAGMMKATDFHQTRIAHMNKMMNYKMAQRNLRQQQVLFDTLLSYGAI